MTDYTFFNISESLLLGSGGARSNDLHPLAYESPVPKYSAEAVLKLLLNKNIDHSQICTRWPVANVTSNATFVVDITSLKHPDDVRKDFFGKWIHSGSHPFTFKASFEDGEVCVERCARGATGNVFYLRRLHSYHPSNTDFRRMLAFVSGRLCTIQTNSCI